MAVMLRERAQQPKDQAKALKVGQLARRTGLSVRTLHYYGEIGLLQPSLYTDTGHRLYTTKDIVRLQQIKSLRQLGFTLDEVKACLDSPNFSPQWVITQHVSRLREQIRMQEELCRRLEHILSLSLWLKVESGDEFIKTIEEMTKMEEKWTPEQLDYFKQRRELLGEEHIHAVEAEWPQLIASVGAEMDKGTDPSDPRVRQMAERWMELVREFTGGDAAITNTLANSYKEDPTQGGRLDPRMLEYMAYVQKALASNK